MVQVVREDSQKRQQVRVRDEADPFARLHPGRRLFLPSLSPEGADCTNGQSTLHLLLHHPPWLLEEGGMVLGMHMLLIRATCSSAHAGLLCEHPTLRHCHITLQPLV